MTLALFVIAVANAVLFVVLGVVAVVRRRRVKSRSVRRLSALAPAFAVLLASMFAQRAMLLAVELEWTHHFESYVLGLWSQLQDVALIVVATGTLYVLWQLKADVESSRVAAEVRLRRVVVGMDLGTRLTARERDVLGVMAEGDIADCDIAARLGVKPSTASTHIRNMMAKTNIRDRRDLVMLAEARSMVDKPQLRSEGSR